MTLHGSGYHGDYGSHEHSDDDHDHGHAHKRAKTSKQSKAKAGLASTAPGPSRTRPTNNQLLYKAHFRLQHMNLTSTAGMVEDTDACPSVASCFLQVLQGLQKAEQLQPGGPSKRSILQMLSSNTRRTKVVELSSGTHRIPDELKRNYLTDAAGGQYSTNLDRNRYGSDDCYLHTVIRYDLEYLGLCPCAVDVEIIDSKAGNASTLVRCGLEGCTCSNKAQHIAAEAAAEGAATASTAPPAPAPIPGPLSMARAGSAVMAAPPGSQEHELLDPMRGMAGRLRPNSPQRSTNSGSSGLLDALMPPAGHSMPDVAASTLPSLLDPKSEPDLLASGTGAMLLPFAKPQPPTGAQLSSLQQQQQQQEGKMDPPLRRQRPAPQKSRSRLWSMLSQGELNSIQNALDEYVIKGGGMDDEIFSGPNGLRLLPAADGNTSDPAGEGSAKVGTKRKPPRSNSSFLLMGANSTAFSGLSKLGLFEEESDDSFRQEELAGKLDSSLLPSLEEGGETGTGGDIGKAAQLNGDQDGPQAKHHRPVARQFTVSSIGVAGAAFEKMAAEVEALKAENQRLKQAAQAKSNGAGSSVIDAAREFELEQQLMEGRAEIKMLKAQLEAVEQREQTAQGQARAAEERNAVLAAELNKSRQDFNALLAKLSNSTLHFGNTFLPVADQFQNSMKQQQAQPGRSFDLNSQLALLQQQQQQQRPHDSGLFGGAQASTMLNSQGHLMLNGQGPMLSSLHSSPLGMTLPLGHSR